MTMVIINSDDDGDDGGDDGDDGDDNGDDGPAATSRASQGQGKRDPKNFLVFVSGGREDREE